MIYTRELNQLFKELGYEMTTTSDHTQCNEHYTIGADTYTVELVIPGIKREEVTVSAENDILIVKVDAPTPPVRAKNYAKLSRSYKLGHDADLDSISATHADGILTVTVPKVKPKKKVRSVTVN